jgi:hypothetical protein
MRLDIKEQEIVKQILSKYEPEGIQCRDLRTRQSATQGSVIISIFGKGKKLL